MSRMCCSSAPIVRGVKPRLTSERRRVCSGGSWLSIISRCIARCGSSISSNRASRLEEENRSECREMCTTSWWVVTAQKPGSPSCQ